MDSPHERAWRDALDELMQTVERRPPETSFSLERFTSEVYQQVISGDPPQRCAGGAQVLQRPGRRASVEGVRRPEAVHGDRAHRGRRVHRVPRRAALHHRGQGRRNPSRRRSSSKNAGLFLGTIRLDTFAQENGLQSEQVTPGHLPGRRQPRGAGEGRLAQPGACSRRDHARRGEIATDDACFVAARAGCEPELYRRRCLPLVYVRHHSSKGQQSCPALSNSDCC